MAISLKTAGTWVVSTAGAAVALSLTGSGAAGDRYYIYAVSKAYNSNMTTPTGWTKVADYADGTVANGDGVGSVKVSAFYRDWESGIGNPTIAWTGTVSPSYVVMNLYSKGSTEVWSTPTWVGGNRAATATTTGATAGSSLVIPSGAMVMACVGLRDDSTTFTRSTTGGISDLSATIAWNGNYVEAPATHGTTTNGNDLAADLGHRFVTTGGTATLTAAMTTTAAETGAVLWVSQGVFVPAAALTLVDDFNTGSVPDAAKWSVSGTVALTSGRATFSASSAINSLIQYNLVGSSAKVQVTAASAGAVFGVWNIQDVPTGNTGFYGFHFGSGTNVQAMIAGSVSGLPSRTHTNGDWYRISQSGTTLTWEYSTEGYTWSTLHTATVAAGLFSATYLRVGNYALSGTTFDNFNIVPVFAFTSLVDNFSTGSVPDSKWVTVSGSPAIASGLLSLSAATGAIRTRSLYNLTNASVLFQAWTMSAGAAGLLTAVNPGVNIGFQYNDATTVQATVAGGVVGSTRTHTPGDWYRLREAAGTLYWDYSADGVNWSTLHSSSHAVVFSDGATLAFGAGASTTTFDNVNFAPGPPISVLRDTFPAAIDTGIWDTTLWTWSSGVASAQLFSLGSYSLTTDAFYDFTAGTLTWQHPLVSLDINTGGFSGITSNNLRWGFNLGSGGSIQAIVSGSLVGSSITHTNGNWYRLRESAGTLYYEYSTNGASWTLLHSTTTLPVYLFRVFPYFEVYNSGFATAQVTLDNVNAPPGPLVSTFVETFNAGTYPGNWLEAITPSDDWTFDGTLRLNYGSTDDPGNIFVYNAGPGGLTGWDLTGSSVFWEIVTPAVTDGAVVSMVVGLNDHFFYLPYIDNHIYYSSGYGGELDGGVYDGSGAHRWLKLSESGGTVTYWTSPNGTTWTARHTIPFAGNRSDFFVTYGGGPHPSTSGLVWRMDNINNLPSSNQGQSNFFQMF